MWIKKNKRFQVCWIAELLFMMRVRFYIKKVLIHFTKLVHDVCKITHKDSVNTFIDTSSIKVFCFLEACLLLMSLIY